MQKEVTSSPFTTLEEIVLRKEQIEDEIDRDGDKIAKLWGDFFAKSGNSTRGEYIGKLIANSVTAIDAFIMVRKLMKNHGSLFSFLSFARKKKRK